jgi:hypothetical protein
MQMVRQKVRKYISCQGDDADDGDDDDDLLEIGELEGQVTFEEHPKEHLSSSPCLSIA